MLFKWIFLNAGDGHTSQRGYISLQHNVCSVYFPISEHLYKRSSPIYFHAPHFRVLTTQFPNIQHPSFNPFLYFMRHKDTSYIAPHKSSIKYNKIKHCHIKIYHQFSSDSKKTNPVERNNRCIQLCFTSKLNRLEHICFPPIIHS